jgi:hypothetical protein
MAGAIMGEERARKQYEQEAQMREKDAALQQAQQQRLRHQPAPMSLTVAETGRSARVRRTL